MIDLFTQLLCIVAGLFCQMQRDRKNNCELNDCDKVSLLTDWDADNASVFSKCAAALSLDQHSCSFVWGQVKPSLRTDVTSAHQQDIV